MIDNTMQLRREITAERSALAENIAALEHKARELTDWRMQVRKRPLASVGVALAAGVALALLVPRRRGRRIRHLPAATTVEGNGNGAGEYVAEKSLLSNPIVARVVGALVAVAAGKAVELLAEAVPGFTEHLEKEEAEPTVPA